MQYLLGVRAHLRLFRGAWAEAEADAHASLAFGEDTGVSLCPGLIVLDLLMPELDGFAFAAEVRRGGPWRDVPIVVLTARDLTDDDRRRLSGDVQRILQTGADDAARLRDEGRRLVAAGAGARPGGDPAE